MEKKKRVYKNRQGKIVVDIKYIYSEEEAANLLIEDNDKNTNKYIMPWEDIRVVGMNPITDSSNEITIDYPGIKPPDDKIISHAEWLKYIENVGHPKQKPKCTCNHHDDKDLLVEYTSLTQTKFKCKKCERTFGVIDPARYTISESLYSKVRNDLLWISCIIDNILLFSVDEKLSEDEEKLLFDIRYKCDTNQKLTDDELSNIRFLHNDQRKRIANSGKTFYIPIHQD